MQDQTDRWFRLLGGPDWDGPAGRDCAVSEMRALGTEAVFPLLIRKLASSDLEVRCAAIEALGLVDAARAVEPLIPLLSDSEEVVRMCVCEALSDPMANAAVDPLLVVLRDDPDSQVRNYAAGALGHIGSRAVIPALLRTMDSDHEMDIHGHSPSHCAAMALDDLLETNFTRIKVSESTCKMRPGPPDLDALRKRAMEEYEKWTNE